MIEIRFDGKSGKYERKSSSLDAVNVISEMSGVIVGMIGDIRDQIGHEEAQIFINVVQKYMEKIDLTADAGKEMIQ
ncbi:MAG: hypothetical protein ACI4O4_00975 [Candidatus Ventricola sp.]